MSTKVLSPTHGILISALITASYVGGLYVSKYGRTSFTTASHQPRDDDGVIKTRLKAAVFSTLISYGIVFACLVQLSPGDQVPWDPTVTLSLDLLGLRLHFAGFRSIVPHLLTFILYTGPLTAHFLSGALPLQRNWSSKEDLYPLFCTWIGIRNYIVAPITEELVFRSCLLAVAELSRRGIYYKIFITPLWFGVAHFHHTYERYNAFGRTRAALARAVATCLTQVAYTTLFGMYAAFLLIRTESILAPITAHVTANILGLPHPHDDIHEHPNHRLLVFTAYIVGVVAFVYVLCSELV